MRNFRNNKGHKICKYIINQLHLTVNKRNNNKSERLLKIHKRRDKKPLHSRFPKKQKPIIIGLGLLLMLCIFQFCSQDIALQSRIRNIANISRLTDRNRKLRKILGFWRKLNVSIFYIFSSKNMTQWLNRRQVWLIFRANLQSGNKG